ncbi:MAG: pyruvate kinase, partial [Armatimonadota bacterium]
MRRTKIVCTIGPATESPEMLRALAEAGMNVARLNFSHGTKERHGERIRQLRQIEQERRVPIAILQDLPGPKLRTGPMLKPVELRPGQRFVFTTRDVPGNDEEVNLPYPELIKQARMGNPIFIDDGQLEFRIQSTTPTDIIATVIVGGILG